MIYASAIDLSGREREYVNDCLSRGWITQGKYVRQFEESFADMCGVKYAIACNSGTSALHLAMLALGIGPSDAVIVPSLTYVATANAVRYCGAEVRFADIDRDSWCMSYSSAMREWEKLKESRCYERAIVLPVHTYDSRARTDYDCTGNFPSWIVEDAAHRTERSQEAIFSSFSFYASKIIACGEGGMVTTNDEGLADLVRLYRGQGATIPGRYHHSVVGYNYRMTDLQGAIGLAQLERLPEMIVRRREIVDRYRYNLGGTWIALQGGERSSGWTCAILVPEDTGRDRVAARMFESGIETRPFFEPLHTLPMYRDVRDVRAYCPTAERVAKRGLCLPTHVLLSHSQIDYVCDRLLAITREIAA